MGIRKLRLMHRCALALCLLAGSLAHASSVSLARHELKSLPKEAASAQRAAIFAQHYRQLLIESPGLPLAELGASAARGSPFELKPRAEADSLSPLTVLNESLAELRALSEEALSDGERATLGSLLERILAELAPDEGSVRRSREGHRIEREPRSLEPVLTEPLSPRLVRVGESQPFTLFVHHGASHEPEVLLRDNINGRESVLDLPFHRNTPPVLSPDGETIYSAYGINDGTTPKSIARYSTRSSTRLEDLKPARPTPLLDELNISPDGRFLFYRNQSGLVVEALTEGPNPWASAQIPYNGGHPGYTISPDSRWLATATALDQGLQFRDLVSGEMRVLKAPKGSLGEAYFFHSGQDGHELVDIVLGPPREDRGRGWLVTYDLTSGSEVAREDLPDFPKAGGHRVAVFVDGGRGISFFQWGESSPDEGRVWFYERETGYQVIRRTGGGFRTLGAAKTMSAFRDGDMHHYDLEAGYRAAFDPDR